MSGALAKVSVGDRETHGRVRTVRDMAQEVSKVEDNVPRDGSCGNEDPWVVLGLRSASRTREECNLASAHGVLDL